MDWDLHPIGLARALVLLAVANGSPVFAKALMGQLGNWPLDCGVALKDGQRLFGSSKTVRGIILAVLLSALVAMPLGVEFSAGALAGIAAMLGDLLSSFTKRRLRLPPSSMAPGLDQIPESLLPLMACASRLGLSHADVALGVIVFWAGELIFSQVLYRLKVKDRPY